MIFVVPQETTGGGPHVTIAASGSGRGGLDEPHAARNSQDASSRGSESEAWIDGEEGSINLALRAAGHRAVTTTRVMADRHTGTGHQWAKWLH
ncbi:hypothetical protein GCM10023336_51200 [Streptomyces similanensis]|uniref:Uncharacterized protein n=1 Tax=Streptomyces similanensis TaxID=1274988 RepID=A0ABP9KYZ2_9ACTN